MRTKTSRATVKARRGVLPDDACPACGTLMKPARGKLRLPVNGEEVTVPGVSHLACPKCHETVLTADEARDFGQRAVTLYRDQHGLLSAREIRALRERFGLTQGDLARLLRLGANTISRWEAGRNVQTAAMDVLLRLLRDLPGSVKYLRDHAA